MRVNYFFHMKSLLPKVGVLALTLDLYEQMAPGLRPSREAWLRQAVIPKLQTSLEVHFDRAVYSREEIETSVAQLEAKNVDALVVILLTYSPSQLALPALQRTRLPILIWNTQELLSVDDSFSINAMIDNHGVHGSQDLANVLLRSGIRFHYVTSHWQDESGVGEVMDFCHAAAAARRLRACRIGLLGYPFPGMGDFAVDTTYLAGSLGCSWKLLTVEDYLLRAAQASHEEVNSLAANYHKLYAVSKEVTPADLISTARVEIALRGMVRDYQLNALTYQFMAFGDDERTTTLPFVAASRLMADGIGFGGEGDLVAAAGTAFLNGLNPPASFSEIFTVDFAGNSLFMSHMGEANVAMARKDRLVALVARPTPITRTRDRQLALVTSFEPGPATFMALTQVQDRRWRLIVSAVQIEDYGPLKEMCVPHFKMKPAGDVRDFLTRYAQAGGPHHNAICFGDARRRLKLAALILGLDYFEIPAR